MSAFIRRLGRVSGRILTKLPVPIADGGTGATSAGAATTALGAAALTAQTFTQIQRWSKGGDILSASPLVIDTDGNFFDVTGTTNFAAMTVVAGSWFVLQFDAVLTMTHHSTNLDLPGQANITTAAGDVATFFATGTNTVQCTSYTRASGEAIVAGGGGLYTWARNMAAESDSTDTTETSNGVEALGSGLTSLALVDGDEIVIDVGSLHMASTDGSAAGYELGLTDGSNFYPWNAVEGGGNGGLMEGGDTSAVPNTHRNGNAMQLSTGRHAHFGSPMIFSKRALGLSASSLTWQLAFKHASGTGIIHEGSATGAGLWAMGVRRETT